MRVSLHQKLKPLQPGHMKLDMYTQLGSGITNGCEPESHQATPQPVGVSICVSAVGQDVA